MDGVHISIGGCRCVSLGYSGCQRGVGVGMESGEKVASQVVTACDNVTRPVELGHRRQKEGEMGRNLSAKSLHMIHWRVLNVFVAL